MSGIRTESRQVALERLQRRTKHELDQARDKSDAASLPRLRELLARLEQEITVEAARTAALAPRPPRHDHVGDHLRTLGVTAHDVKVWAVDQGLLDRVRRGRIRAELVNSYAEAVS